jgi:hypothetical protein
MDKYLMCAFSFSCKNEIESHMEVHIGEKSLDRSLFSVIWKFKYLQMIYNNLHWRQIIFLAAPCVQKVVRQKSLIAESFKSSHRKETILLPLVHKDICSNNSWQKYLRTHTGEKPYSCSHCSKSSSQLCELKSSHWR